MRRSGGQPINLFHTTPSLGPFSAEGLIGRDSHRLRSVVYRYADEDSGDELVRFLLPAVCLECLEIRGNGSFQLPTLFSGATPCLRDLVISRCTPWPSNQFGSLTSLSLLGQMDIDANIDSLLNILRHSPHLEELLLERKFGSSVQPQHPQKNEISSIPLHSLKRLYICRVSVGATKRLMGALDLLPNGVSMQCTDVSMDFGATFPEAVMSKLPPRVATKLELIYPPAGGVILHATNGVAHTRFVERYHPRCRLFSWITERPREEYPLKEFWLHLDKDNPYEVPPPHALRNLETLVVVTDPCRMFNSTLPVFLFPNGDGIPSPFLSTLELPNVSNVTKLMGVFKARLDAGFRLIVLRIRWFDGCEARMALLEYLPRDP